MVMIELYTPPHRRVYSYLRLPELGQEAQQVGAGRMEELDLMRAWLGLDREEIGSGGELAAAVRG